MTGGLNVWKQKEKMMNEDNLKIKVEGFSRMPEGDKKNQVRYKHKH
jgi:hypothetical protein